MKPLRILILGGTGFTGPYQVRYALSRGHTVTTFNRGKTHPGELPNEVEQLIGDRNGKLDALKNRQWDVVIDNPFPQGTPRVWFGPDYAVVVWFDQPDEPSRYQVTMYTWVGRWRRWQVPVVDASPNLADMHVAVSGELIVEFGRALIILGIVCADLEEDVGLAA